MMSDKHFVYSTFQFQNLIFIENENRVKRRNPWSLLHLFSHMLYADSFVVSIVSSATNETPYSEKSECVHNQAEAHES